MDSRIAEYILKVESRNSTVRESFVDAVCLVMSGYLVCFTRRIVEVQGDPLHRSPSAVDLAPTPRCVLTASIVIFTVILSLS